MTSPALLRVVRGDATPEEVAALVAVLAVAGRAAPAAEPAPAVGRWADRRCALSGPVTVGSGAWLASGRAPGVRTRASW